MAEFSFLNLLFGLFVHLMQQRRKVDRVHKKERVGIEMWETGHRPDSNPGHLHEGGSHEVQPKPRGHLRPMIAEFVSW